MSDGPYRSLPMPRGWKRLAAFAQNSNFAPGDVCHALVPALREDWRTDVPAPVVEGVRDAFLDKQGSLFAAERDERMEGLRRSTATHGLGRLLVECADATLRAGASGEDALAAVGKDTLLMRASRGVRQVEEHYQREGAALQARDVRDRLEEGIRGAPLDSLSRELLGIGPSLPRAVLKHDDLDDGVPLP